MLISHRTSAYVDAVELERAAGMVEQRVNSGALDGDEAARDRHIGAAIALRILLWGDVRGAADYMTTFSACVEEQARRDKEEAERKETHEEA